MAMQPLYFEKQSDLDYLKNDISMHAKSAAAVGNLVESVRLWGSFDGDPLVTSKEFEELGEVIDDYVKNRPPSDKPDHYATLRGYVRDAHERREAIAKLNLLGNGQSISGLKPPESTTIRFAMTRQADAFKNFAEQAASSAAAVERLTDALTSFAATDQDPTVSANEWQAFETFMEKYISTQAKPDGSRRPRRTDFSELKSHVEVELARRRAVGRLDFRLGSPNVQQK
ncbi:MAG: hypothetical protein R3C68_00355 [Myxococcota bacterium]